MANTQFSASVSKFITKSEKLSEAVYKQAAQLTIEEAQSRCRVRTGFLINSGIASLNTSPIGESENTGVFVGAWNPSTTILTINRAKLNDSIVFGWTANYARYRENKDGFVRLAAQNWGKTVNLVVKELKARFR